MHKGISLLSTDRGLFEATVYGGYKGSGNLGGSTDPFTWGRYYCYRDPVRERIKITDAEVHSLFEGVRGDLPRYYTACFWAEIILVSFGAGGELQHLFPLLLSSLQALDKPGTPLEQLFIQFGWRFLELLGLRSETGECSSCGHAAAEREPLYMDKSGNGFLCGTCSAGRGMVLGPGSLRYLDYTAFLPLEAAVGIGIDASTRKELKAVILGLITAAVEKPLKTMELL
jgi:DNA repair protein RecO (recombination protein O)